MAPARVLELEQEANRLGAVPLVMPPANADIGAAAGAAVVALLCGMKLCRVPAASGGLRLAAAGPLPPGLAGGSLVVWGSGAAGRPEGVDLSVRATRGPFTRALLGGPDVFGDPAWLLPWFHRVTVPKRWELGLVLLPGQKPPPGLPDGVCAIPGDAPDGPAALAARVDAVLACRRIASACAGALVLAETYGIPCLPLAAADGQGLRRVPTTEAALGLGVADFYAGLRRSAVPAYLHPPGTLPAADRLAAAIDKAWSPAWLREDDLIETFPLPCAPLMPEDGDSAFAHPVLAETDPAQPPGPASVRPAAHPAASLQDWVDENGVVPAAWAATSGQAPFPNLGDALSAVIVSAITGLKLQRRNFDDRGERLVAVGTIGHAQRNGTVHLWGTALDPQRNAFDPARSRFAVPPDTRFVVHATRGRNTAARLREAGVPCPDVYGDPVWFLPRLVGGRPVTPRWELGVVLHITEMQGPTPDAGVLAAYKRYHIPPMLAGAVRLISTYTEQGTEALLAKVDEIRACRRIVSTSFHGLVIPEAFGIPNMWFSPHAGGGMRVNVNDPDAPMDHRVRDWYSGMGCRRVPVFGTPRLLPTRWDQVIRWLDKAWEPLQPDDAALFEAFPLRKAVSFKAPEWPLDPALFDDACY
jgi:hypothetical protein